jgi:hypothetical protein
MGWTSDDDMLNQMTSNGKRCRREQQKLITPAHNTGGGWHFLGNMGGYPQATTFPSAADLVFRACNELNGDGTTVFGIQHGGSVFPATKHLTYANGLIIAAAGAPWHLKLIDLMAYYRMATTNVTGTGSRALINTNTFTASSSSGLLLTYTNDFANMTKVRFTTTTTLPTGLALNTDYYLVRVSATTARVATSIANAEAGTVVAFTDAGTGTHTLNCRVRNGVECEAFFVAQTAPATGGPNLTASSYTNSSGTAGRAFQGTPSMGAAADAYASRILHSGSAAARYGPFLPKQAGDVGINSVESFTWSGGTAYTGTGVVGLCLGRTLADFPVGQSGGLQERELRNQVISLPQVEDQACLVWLLMSTGSTTNNSPVNTVTEFAWGG